MKRGTKGSVVNGKSSSGLSGLLAKKTYLNGELKAKREVVKGKDISSKTDIHYLNPRNQEALTLDAVSDIYPSIKENGVNTEGVAVEKDGKFYVLDASRRRFCCIEGDQDLPLWVIEGEPTDPQLLKIINDSQEVKKWSYPEHGEYLIKIAKLKKLDIETLKLEELAKELGLGKESLRKRLESLNISDELRMVFPDYEGIPNTYYSELAKIQRSITKSEKDAVELLERFNHKLKNLELTGSVFERQKKTLEALKEFASHFLGKKSGSAWTEKNLGSFDVKGMSAKRKISKDGRKVVFEFNRLPAEVQRKINDLVEQTLEQER